MRSSDVKGEARDSGREGASPPEGRFVLGLVSAGRDDAGAGQPTSASQRLSHEETHLLHEQPQLVLATRQPALHPAQEHAHGLDLAPRLRPVRVGGRRMGGRESGRRGRGMGTGRVRLLNWREDGALRPCGCGRRRVSSARARGARAAGMKEKGRRTSTSKPELASDTSASSFCPSSSSDGARKLVSIDGTKLDASGVDRARSIAAELAAGPAAPLRAVAVEGKMERGEACDREGDEWGEEEVAEAKEGAREGSAAHKRVSFGEEADGGVRTRSLRLSESWCALRDSPRRKRGWGGCPVSACPLRPLQHAGDAPPSWARAASRARPRAGARAAGPAQGRAWPSRSRAGSRPEETLACWFWGGGAGGGGGRGRERAGSEGAVVQRRQSGVS